ncbi:hypothetical protein JW979_12960 [bacterium]|nr:hypothetical protein [candidate division CSSED10-310 bacterium]
MHIAFLVIALLFNALANLLMKKAAVNAEMNLPPNPLLIDRLFHYYLSWPFITGLTAFGLNLLCYTQALAKIKLNVAYPIMTGSGFAIIGIAGYFLFENESLRPIQIIGIAMILIGITLVAQIHSPPHS